MHTMRRTNFDEVSYLSHKIEVVYSEFVEIDEENESLAFTFQKVFP